MIKCSCTGIKFHCYCFFLWLLLFLRSDTKCEIINLYMGLIVLHEQKSCTMILYNIHYLAYLHLRNLVVIFWIHPVLNIRAWNNISVINESEITFWVTSFWLFFSLLFQFRYSKEKCTCYRKNSKAYRRKPILTTWLCTCI